MISKTHYIFVLLLSWVAFPFFLQAQQDRCYTMEADQQLREAYPQLGTLGSFEEWLAPRIKAYEQRPANRSVVLTIPVVFHIIHNGEPVGSGDNISATYINAQVEQLNNDFRRILGSSGYNNNSAGADTELEFCPATVDPSGNPLPEPGINRINRNSRGWSAPPYGGNCNFGFNESYIENTIKPQSQWDANQYFNIWAMGLSCDILGYAQFPSQSGLPGINSNGGPANTDGVVLLNTTIGSTTTPNPAGNTYNRGRTATHEVGHCFGLRHIWGDGGCSVDDYCADTPASDGPNYGCPTSHVSCGSTDMVRNYMDYTNDACMNIFTLDQKARMQAVMANSPRRASLASSTACSGGGGGSGCIAAYPYEESFENGLGGWSQSREGNISWIRRSGTTPSGNTGPSGAAAGSYYMYVESSSPNYPDKLAILQSPCFDLSNLANAELKFQYHMYGSSMGSLRVQASTDGLSWENVWEQSGDQGDNWLNATVALGSYLGNSELRLRFLALTGDGYRSDIAIDNIAFTSGAAPTADFSANITMITAGQSVSFTSLSANSPTSWSWSFPGGTPASSTDKNPTVAYNTPGTYSVSLTASNALGSDTETKPGYITVMDGGSGACLEGVLTFPYRESFESSFGEWEQDPLDDMNWIRQAGATPSSSTGPSGASDGSFYAYVESSSPNYPGRTALLYSPCFDLSAAGNASFSFNYHLYGASSMGSLALQARPSAGGSWATLWSVSGNQGNAWRSASVLLNDYLGGGVELRFVGITGNTWQGDMAIDALELTTGTAPACANVKLTINLDNYPEETSWEITDGSGFTVASGGPYGDRADGSTVEDIICLPAGCYDLIVYDAYGDGLCCAYGAGSYFLEDAVGNVLASGDVFGSAEATNFCVNIGARTSGGLVVSGKKRQSEAEHRLACFPNPARQVLNVRYHSKEARQVQVIMNDLLGRKAAQFAWALQEGENQIQADISRLLPGTYLLQVAGEGQAVRFVVAR